MSDLAANLPDPGSPSLPAFVGTLAAVALGSWGLARGWPRDEIEWFAFVGGIVGAGIGLVIYLLGLITDLY